MPHDGSTDIKTLRFCPQGPEACSINANREREERVPDSQALERDRQQSGADTVIGITEAERFSREGGAGVQLF